MIVYFNLVALLYLSKLHKDNLYKLLLTQLFYVQSDFSEQVADRLEIDITQDMAKVLGKYNYAHISVKNPTTYFV